MLSRDLGHHRLRAIPTGHRQPIRPTLNLSQDQLPKISPFGQLNGLVAPRLSLRSKIKLLSLPTPGLRIKEENRPPRSRRIRKRNLHGKSLPGKGEGHHKKPNNQTSLNQLQGVLNQNPEREPDHQSRRAEERNPNKSPSHNPKPSQDSAEDEEPDDHQPPRKALHSQIGHEDDSQGPKHQRTNRRQPFPASHRMPHPVNLHRRGLVPCSKQTDWSTQQGTQICPNQSNMVLGKEPNSTVSQSDNSSEPSSADGLPFSIEEFISWYEEFSSSRLSPAKGSANQALKERLRKHLDDTRMRRIRVTEGRIKEPLRAYRRLAEKASGQEVKPEDSQVYLRDLVGLRIVCTNLEDVDSVVSLLNELPTPNDAGEENPGLTCQQDADKDYISKPKQSGYRSIHFDLYVPVVGLDGLENIRCELQVRTLLQDSWGELTHEDTYKPGSEVPHIINVMSRRMADVMATLDDMAQDLRNVLSQEADSEIAEVEAEAVPTRIDPSESPSREKSEHPTIADSQAPEAKAFLAARSRAISAPLSFAELAFEARREFGPEASHYWFGYGNFKRLLVDSIPTAQVVETGPGYVIPLGKSPQDFDLEKGGNDSLPTGIRRLRNIDDSFPAVDSEIWPKLFAAISEASEQISRQARAEPPSIYGLSMVARDQTPTGKASNLGRNSLNYVARCILFTEDLRNPLSPTYVANLFVDSQTARLRRLGTPQSDIDDAEAWLRGYLPPGQKAR